MKKEYLNARITNNYGSKNNNWVLDTRKKHNGKLYGSRYFFRTKREAEEAKNKMMANGELEIRDEENTCTELIKDVFMKYAKSEYYRKKKKKSGKNVKATNRDKISRYNNHLDKFFGDKKINEINSNMLIDVTRYIEEEEDENGDQINESLQYRLWIDVKAFVNYCMDYEYINEVIRFPIQAGICKPGISPPTSWSRQEFDLFMEQVNIDVERHFFHILALCGPRKSEARGIKYKAVNFINNTIHIGTQLKNVKEGDTQLKTKNSIRDINVPDIVMNEIKGRYEKLLKTGISVKEAKEQYVYVDEKNKPLPYETLRRHYGEYVDKAGIQYLSIHHLRHYYGTQAAANGASSKYILNQMGHSSSQATLIDHYLNVTSEETKRNMQKMNEMYPVEDKAEE